MDELIFDEQELIDEIKIEIENTFNTNEWKKMFGNKKMKIYNSLTIDKPSFPCIIVTVIEAIPNLQMRTSRQVEEYTNFVVEIETYNQAVEVDYKKISKEELGIKINNALRLALNKRFRFEITSNEPLMNIDSTIYRRRIVVRGIMDNKNKKIYI